MTDSSEAPDAPDEPTDPDSSSGSVADVIETGLGLGSWKDDTLGGERAGGLAPSEAFQALASEVRVTVLCELLAAERAGESPCTFSELQKAADADSSAGFAYHLRQLDGHFVSQTTDGYELTPAGRRAAQAIVSGAFTSTPGDGRAS